jgi:genome maintenance exonuclease 1
MKYNQKFEYKPLKDITSPDGSRVYEVDGVKLPSVTTILSQTKSAQDRASLAKWRAKVGNEEADRVIKESTDIGSKFHHNMENYIKHGTQPEGSVLVKLMSNIMINKGLANLDEWWGVECPLYTQGLYAGTADLVGVYKRLPCIGDFKNSRKKKKIDWIKDYRCQLAAYALAHNEMFGTDIKSGVILMVTRECEFIEFLIDGELFKESVDMWLARLDQYYK